MASAPLPFAARHVYSLLGPGYERRMEAFSNRLRARKASIAMRPGLEERARLARIVADEARVFIPKTSGSQVEGSDMSAAMPPTGPVFLSPFGVRVLRRFLSLGALDAVPIDEGHEPLLSLLRPLCEAAFVASPLLSPEASWPERLEAYMLFRRLLEGDPGSEALGLLVDDLERLLFAMGAEERYLEFCELLDAASVFALLDVPQDEDLVVLAARDEAYCLSAPDSASWANVIDLGTARSCTRVFERCFAAWSATGPDGAAAFLEPFCEDFWYDRPDRRYRLLRGIPAERLSAFVAAAIESGPLSPGLWKARNLFAGELASAFSRLVLVDAGAGFRVVETEGPELRAMVLDCRLWMLDAKRSFVRTEGAEGFARSLAGYGRADEIALVRGWFSGALDGASPGLSGLELLFDDGFRALPRFGLVGPGRRGTGRLRFALGLASRYRVLKAARRCRVTGRGAFWRALLRLAMHSWEAVEVNLDAFSGLLKSAGPFADTDAFWDCVDPLMACLEEDSAFESAAYSRAFASLALLLEGGARALPAFHLIGAISELAPAHMHRGFFLLLDIIALAESGFLLAWADRLIESCAALPKEERETWLLALHSFAHGVAPKSGGLDRFIARALNAFEEAYAAARNLFGLYRYFLDSGSLLSIDAYWEAVPWKAWYNPRGGPGAWDAFLATLRDAGPDGFDASSWREVDRAAALGPVDGLRALEGGIGKGRLC